MLVHINSKRYVDMMHFKGLWSFFRREHTSNPANDKSLNVCTSPTDIHYRASSTCRLLIFPQASVCIRSNTTTLNHWFGAILFCLKSSSGPFLQLTKYSQIFTYFVHRFLLYPWCQFSTCLLIFTSWCLFLRPRGTSFSCGLLRVSAREGEDLCKAKLENVLSLSSWLYLWANSCFRSYGSSFTPSTLFYRQWFWWNQKIVLPVVDNYE